MKNWKYLVGDVVMLIFFIAWFKYPDYIQWEPIIGVFIVSQRAIIYFQKNRIDKLEFSPAVSAAHGYVNNFLEPVIGELLSESGTETLMFKVYIPEDLEELTDQQIERIKLKIHALGFDITEIRLKSKKGRPHDVLYVTKKQCSITYFDFPRTLLSLQTYIDYKVPSRKNEFTESKKQDLGKKLVEAFKKEVERLLEKKNLEDVVTFVDKSLNL